MGGYCFIDYIPEQFYYINSRHTDGKIVYTLTNVQLQWIHLESNKKLHFSHSHWSSNSVLNCKTSKNALFQKFYETIS